MSKFAATRTRSLNLTRCRFILNGLAHANTLHGGEIFHLPDWRVIGEYVYDAHGGRHQAFVSPTRDTQVLGTLIKANERVQIERSVKFSGLHLDRLFKLSGLRVEKRFAAGADYYGTFASLSLSAVRKPSFCCIQEQFSLRSSRALHIVSY